MELEVNRIEGNYDDSVRIAAEVAEENSYYVVSDTSYEGYTDIPKDVMQGYTVMVDETMKANERNANSCLFTGWCWRVSSSSSVILS